MPLKTLELELADGIAPIALTGYTGAWILVRYHGHLVGRIRVDAVSARRNGKAAGGVAGASGPPVLTPEIVRAELANQIGLDLVPFILGRRGSSAPPQIPISVIVCTRDREESLERCLESLASVEYPEFEVIVVDNASRTDAAARLAQRFGVRCAREEHAGLDWARNRGIAEAAYPVVAFTDDDAQVDRLWLRRIGQAFAEPEVMAVTGMVAPAELETPAQIRFEEDYGGMGHGFVRRTLRRRTLRDSQVIRASAHGCGVNMAFRRRVFDSVGLFDAALDAGTPSGGAGDIDMLHRLIASGHTLVYEPGALVWHTHRRTESALRRQIFDNGRSFGCYLLTCARNRTVARSSLVRYALVDWFGGWLLRRLVRPRRLPRRLMLAELSGALLSPVYYARSRIQARRTASRDVTASSNAASSNAASSKTASSNAASNNVASSNVAWSNAASSQAAPGHTASGCPTSAPNPELSDPELSEVMVRYGLGWPPGHFYSPIPSLAHVRQHAHRIFAPPPRTLPGIDLNEARQLEMLEAIAPFYPEAPWGDEPREGLRFHYDNPNFRDGESIVLFGFLRHLRPGRVVEIGCGFSSAALLDVNERWFDFGVRCTFVEPYPELLYRLLRPGDRERIDVLPDTVQDIDIARFHALERDDVLIVDSTHVTKIDSDVNHLLFRILPALNPGVVVHFHDVHYPFEYPRAWAEQGRGWNEAYILRAFLQYNAKFEVVFFNDFLARFHRERLGERMPRVGRHPGSSLWLRVRR